MRTEALRLPQLEQLRKVTGAAAPEPKIFTHEDDVCAERIYQQLLREVGRLRLRQLERERLHHHLKLAALPTQQLELAREAGKRRERAAPQHHGRVGIESEHAWNETGFAGHLHRLPQHCLVPAMDTVEIADGYERRLLEAWLSCAEDALGAHAAALLRRPATFQCRRDRSAS
jgi:methylase of polypeptide subunit release factors